MKTSSKSRLFRDGHRLDAPEFGLSEGHILSLERLAVEPERMLGKSSIADQFDRSFFGTDFWYMWCTTFAFQPWHSAVEFKRYLLRFTHMVSGFSRLQGIMRTVYNQYDSLVRPLQKWLDERGVRFELNARVTDLVLREDAAGKRVERIVYERRGRAGEIAVGYERLCHRHPGVDDGGIQSGVHGLRTRSSRARPTAGPGRFGRRSRPAGPSSGARPPSTTISTSPSGSHSPRRSTTLLSSDSSGTPRGTCPGEGGLITFLDSALAHVDRAATSAAFHRTARRRERLLGLWPLRRQARRLREEADVGMHGEGNPDGDPGPSPDRGGVRAESWRPRPASRA